MEAEPSQLFCPDAYPDNADWTKRTWDLPEITSPEKLDAYLESTGLSAQAFACLPVCRWNVSKIPWLRDWLLSHGLPVPPES
ncbi:hypothetical protein [Thermogemmatispora sp.]|uniref:hypothetical protein n=1 Tax=Thermogemmatispora sp. TaxID=1968838 RepID=UPI001D30C72F|nr:hypothetical protein [Thermogemmatispora sp.]MBX5448799.1 hypothetical protein [Thermogemmatispora sp.]